MEVLLQTYYILLPIVTTSLIGWVGVLLRAQKKKEKLHEEEILKKEKVREEIQKANSVGIMLVLRYMLKRYHEEYMIQKKITYNQYEDWMDLYKAYKALGGNSIAEEWNIDVERLEKHDTIDEMSPFESLLKQSIRNKK